MEDLNFQIRDVKLGSQNVSWKIAESIKTQQKTLLNNQVKTNFAQSYELACVYQ